MKKEISHQDTRAQRIPGALVAVINPEDK